MAEPHTHELADAQHEFDTIKSHVNFELPPPTPGQEWRSYSELPTSRDLNPDWDDPEQLAEIHRLLPNTWKEPWKNKDTYLETHYRLQREEGITMLRHSIKKFKEDPSMMDDPEMCIYTKVFVRGYLMTRLGPMCQVQFSTERSGKRIRWMQTRRLTVGTLVAISTASDCFQTICMPAIISEHRVRDGLDQNPPTIHFQWANLDDAVIDPNEELVMIESRSGYFEAVRHSMVGLQHVANTETPLDKYLVNADMNDEPAGYVKENPWMDIRSLVHHVPGSSSMTNSEMNAKMAEACAPLRRYPILDGFDNQLSRYTNLDNSQLSAVHRILTKELAIVQGPPGTGKTFTSVQALQILLESQDRGSNVIIVAAQTNHAVDQILMQLITAGFNVVRLGGRTQNEDIKRYSMYNLRCRAAPSWTQRADRDYKTFESARKKNIAALERAIEEVFPDDVINPDTLRAAGLISTTQLESLKADQAWAPAPSSSDQPVGLLVEWLGSQLVEAKRQDEKDPVFEAVEDDDSLDLDLDAEEYDLELDDCIVEEDDKAGRIDGKFLPIKHLWTGANQQQYTEKDLVLRRELQRPNLWDIDPKYRGAIYQYWQKQLLSLYHKNFCHILVDNVRITKNLKINKWYKDAKCIKSQHIEIIGCTTTGLCKYRGLLSALKPRTMLIEEAAETREANILSALYGSLQQLVLVGDHQQLAPHCDTPGLAEEPYNMRVSMFERLVNLKLPFTVLNLQRRMVPALREVLNPFYPSLQDHPVVTKSDARAPVPGMAVSSFFFHHTWSEGLDENLSRYNILEAEMIVHFMEYLLMNGVKASQITILTFYRGQKKKILAQVKSKPKQWGPFSNVFTVDSYQGEENDIVILSLVRSNGPQGPHKAGFLEDKNRGVVSISRARRGFYIFGNMVNLAHASPESWNMWGKVQDVFVKQGRYGGDMGLPIMCHNHRKITWMSHPEDWVNCHGGCDQKCLEKLSCGHDCGRQCHWINHDKLICREPCERTLPCGHRCQQFCGENCACSCADFTGAYSHDQFVDNDTTPPGGRFGVEYDSSHAAPFITQDQRHIARKPGSRGNRRGLGRNNQGHHVLRSGVGYCSDSARIFGRPNSMRAGDGQSHGWTTFNAHRDDQRRRREDQIQLDFTGAPIPRSNPTEMAIQETFHPITLDHEGIRNTDDGTIARPTQSPDKDDDLLNFDDAVMTVALTGPPLNLGSNPIRPDDLPDTISESEGEIATSILTKGDPGALSTQGDSQHGRTLTASFAHTGVTEIDLVQQSRPRAQLPIPGHAPAVRQANRPEWELASMAETASVGDAGEVGNIDGIDGIVDLNGIDDVDGIDDADDADDADNELGDGEGEIESNEKEYDDLIIF
ncbi:P-loop containing nucleoside triphosphate hydrolase protein [Hypoxylon sp. FL0543]|nr:P-loop containing nucleoside triphosphate hydrolase protein [Hypoxylon sp. FL0543]